MQTLTVALTGPNGRIIQLEGPLGDGANGGRLALVVNATGNGAFRLQAQAGGNTFSGGVTVNGGVLSVWDGESHAASEAVASNPLGDNAVLLTGGTLQLCLKSSVASLRLTYNNAITVTGDAGLDVRKTTPFEGANLGGNSNVAVLGGGVSLGAHTLTFSGDPANSFFAFDLGNLSLTSASGGTSVLKMASTGVTIGNVAGNATAGNTATLLISGAASQGTTLAGVISDGGQGGKVALAKEGTVLLNITGAQSYTGSTAITDGEVRLNGGDNRLPTGTDLIVGKSATATAANATLNMNTFHQTVATLSDGGGAGGRILIGNGKALTVNTPAANALLSTTYGGLLEGSGGGLVKSGAGSLTLTGVNTHTGPTSVTGGTLAVGGAGSLNASSAIQLNGADATFRYASSVALTRTVTFLAGGGTFLYDSAEKYGGSIAVGAGQAFGGNGAVGNVTLNTGGTLAPGDSLGTLTVDNLTLNGGGVWQWQIGAASGAASGAAGTAWDAITVAAGGGLTLNATGSSPVLLELASLGDPASGLPGALAGFDPFADYTWAILTLDDAVNTIDGFDEAAFELRPGAFIAANPESAGGAFSLALSADSKSLELHYAAAPVPEPQTWALLGMLGLAALLARPLRRRVRRRGAV